ncbi:MOSC domain-containing protein [Nocardioides antri]|uniref:MOSC domain-containing protein n=1 Tax=Nocardioides antri TaxID=2607659 RepID=A0A5B1M664_9ACTN|nr:MOSC N-terminal beta barrel domain-containing protein [Nocardioides antri]KAA1428785.1 MOSC domain-containing protein [Nocardioides antri]
MKILELWRYPVKSLQGEAVDAVSLEDDGVVGDRRWGIRDEGTGLILTARRRPELLFASASYDGDQPVITLPDGRTAVGPGPGTDGALSEWLGRPVTLVGSTSSEPGRAEFFADPIDDSSEAIEWTMPSGRYVDAAPVLLLTTASLDAGAGLHRDGIWDPRRFRPNMLIEVDAEGWVEDAWVGRPLQAGDATLAPVEPCVRCTMVTRPQDGLDADPGVFRTLARHHRGHFGVWSRVTTPGTISVGDQVSVATTPTADA